jgi:hypothetical protein
MRQERDSLLEVFKPANDQIVCDRGYDAEWLVQTNIFLAALKRTKDQLELPARSKRDNEILHETRSRFLECFFNDFLN